MGEFADIFSNTWAFALVMLFFGGSIFVHELGHFLAARMRGLKILRFSIGFGPKLFSAKGRDGCEYIISLLPFGGYVALPQLADMGALEGGKGGETGKTPQGVVRRQNHSERGGGVFQPAVRGGVGGDSLGRE